MKESEIESDSVSDDLSSLSDDVKNTETEVNSAAQELDTSGAGTGRFANLLKEKELKKKKEDEKPQD